MTHRRSILIGLFILALLALAVLGAVALKNQETAIELIAVAPVAPTDTPEAMTIASHEVTFICEDSSSFIAAFDPEVGEEVKIYSGGMLIRTLQPEAGIPNVYVADDGVRYAFAGEGVSVTLADRSTDCTQPFDPENAPYNFGD